VEQSAAAAPINRITRVFTHRIIFALRSGRARAELEERDLLSLTEQLGVLERHGD